AAGMVGLGVGRLRSLPPAACLMAITAWLSVITGTYVVYPWYRAKPGGEADLTAYPQAYLEAHPELSQWHLLGMEWKEHVGCLTLGLITSVAENSKPILDGITFIGPVGSLSGKTSVATASWLAAWSVLHRRWKEQQLDFPRVFGLSLILIGLGLLGTFPPFWH